jgi:hypothetical protein
MSAEHDPQAVTEPAPAEQACADGSPTEHAVRAIPVVMAGATLTSEILAAAMQDCGLSRRQLARAMDVSSGVVDAWVDGRRPLTLASVDKMPAGLALRILERMRVRIEGRRYGRRSSMAPSRHITIASMSLGQIAAQVIAAEADGVVTEDEKQKIAREYVRHGEVVVRALEDLQS